MTISYNKLWKLLIDRKMRKMELQKAAGVSANVLARLGRDEFVSLESIGKICLALNCRIDDILEFKAESGDNDND